MSYTDNYERDIYGIIAFWVQNNFDHGRFFDREISHYEVELARTNQYMIQHLGTILEKAKSKKADVGTLINEAQHATHEFHSLLTYTLDKALRCEVIISTPQSLLDHMIREAEETVSVFKLLQTGKRVSPADATIHENYFWLRQMADHLSFISHYLDTSNYELHDRVRQMTKKFENLFLQANALRTMIRRPRNEVLPVLHNFNQMVIKEAKDLEAFKLELDDLIKRCAAVTTSPPDLLEHIAREAHHLWRNLEDQVIL
ncbi:MULTISPECIES: DUF2935 domain-containing protein [unclassified Thermoactinomyces]|jgi:hypothetical protein|uniref:DUF2935 domain-containing protein n=1 Tax=unclassified Thermoactinomyces TaxID=2634588 RepID=UPI0018DD7093|nr:MULTISPECIES: DUF2935 domain-containing protein [unclassified Thermoactinomyces]MBH8599215.1 DUF2935 domain-containing protein [Thermoactinomyces sp. CICC 10523]MBH8605358.1 DUF2935 domain-containing protein [Thermoactinomyces sp. CICC 10522]MBH8609016.1 DUF2935 domain-containing protein [Thermoactinomyces sp. CICC 10521]